MFIPESQQIFDASSEIQATVLTGSAETLILANAVFQIPLSTEIGLSGAIYLTPGSDTTQVTVRIREHYGLTGAIVWEVPRIGVTPGVMTAIPICGAITGNRYQDPSPGGQYSVTVQQSGTSAGSVWYGSVSWFNLIFATPQA